DFNIDSYGSFADAIKVHLNDIFFHGRGVEVRMTGDYVSNVAEPLSLSLFVNHRPSDIAPEEKLPISGRFLSEGHAGGTLDPVHLTIKGVVHSENLVLRGRPYGDMRGAISGSVEPDRTTIVIGDLAFLGGAWSLTSLWPYDAKDKLTDTEALRV